MGAPVAGGISGIEGSGVGAMAILPHGGATRPPAGAQPFAQALAHALAGLSAPRAETTAAGHPTVTLGEMLGRSPFVSQPQAVGPGPAVAAHVAPGGQMVVPAAGRVSSDFGPRVHPITGQRKPHTGIDIAAPAGAPVRAAAAGTVTFAGARGGYGNLVIVDHGDGRETYYAHNSAHHVAVGARVAAGQHIAAIGQTGMATGPHLHFEVRVQGEAVDPRTHVAFA